MKCRYCDDHPEMEKVGDNVYECPECSYEHTEEKTRRPDFVCRPAKEGMNYGN